MMKNRKKKAGVCLLIGLLACLLCAAPVLAMENGEAGITPDPPDTIVTDPVTPPDPVVSQPDPGPSQDPSPPSSTPDTPSEPDPVSSGPASSGGGNSQASEPQEPSGSQVTSSRVSRPNTTSSRVVYSDPDPRESYVEYIPPSNQTGNQNNHTTSAQNPVAVAPVESNTELLSSQNWEALLSTPSQPDGVPNASSALAPIAGIFGEKEDAHGVSILLIIGIVMLVLGAGGVGFFIYSQFIYKRRKAKKNAEDEDFYGDSDGYYDGYTQDVSRGNTEPLPYVPTERDISSFSDPQMKPVNPLKKPEQPPSPPKRNRVEVEDIDWDQFFKDNK